VENLTHTEMLCSAIDAASCYWLSL